MSINVSIDKINTIREISKEKGYSSWTSDNYQNDIISFVMDHSEGHGSDIIEVGTFKGGLSAILAYLATQLNGVLYTLDIKESYLKNADSFISGLGFKNVEYFQGSLEEFSRLKILNTPPLLIVIDGDHSCKGVIEDIMGLYLLNKRPYAAVFHDYGLRNDTFPDIKVDHAIMGCFGGSVIIQPVGDQIGEESKVPTFDQKADDGHYWVNSEGVLIILPDADKLQLDKLEKLNKLERSQIVIKNPFIRKYWHKFRLIIQQLIPFKRE
jgi:hypothetical protein